MTKPDASVSPVAATAIALGTVVVTDLAKRAMLRLGFDKVPHEVKVLTASALAVAGSVYVEDSVRGRVLTACAASGLARVVHSLERAQRAQGDMNKLVFYQSATAQSRHNLR